MSPVEFYELPQGTPSVVPAAQTTTVAGYCTASDTCSLNKARVPGVGNNPTIGDIDGYILMVAGQIDGVLLNKGWTVPVNVASHPEVAGLLNGINAHGAARILEESSPAPQQQVVDRLNDAFTNAMGMLEQGRLTIDADTEPERANPRAPWITFHPTGRTYDPLFSVGPGGDGISSPNGCNDPANPLLSRQMRF